MGLPNKSSWTVPSCGGGRFLEAGVPAVSFPGESCLLVSVAVEVVGPVDGLGGFALVGPVDGLGGFAPIALCCGLGLLLQLLKCSSTSITSQGRGEGAVCVDESVVRRLRGGTEIGKLTEGAETWLYPKTGCSSLIGCSCLMRAMAPSMVVSSSRSPS